MSELRLVAERPANLGNVDALAVVIADRMTARDFAGAGVGDKRTGGLTRQHVAALCAGLLLGGAAEAAIGHVRLVPIKAVGDAVADRGAVIIVAGRKYRRPCGNGRDHCR